MDGEALAAWLAKHYPRVPVIFVSGFPSEAPGELPGPLLAKPFTPEALCAIVRETLARRHPAAQCRNNSIGHTTSVGRPKHAKPRQRLAAGGVLLFVWSVRGARALGPDIRVQGVGHPA